MRGTTRTLSVRQRLTALVLGGSTATAAFLLTAPAASATPVSPPSPSLGSEIADALTMTADTANSDVIIVDPSLWQIVANIVSTSLDNAQANGSLGDALATSTFTPVTWGIRPISSRTDEAQCPQVMPVTVMVVVALMSKPLLDRWGTQNPCRGSLLVGTTAIFTIPP